MPGRDPDLDLLTAIAEQARRDAAAGCADALAWLQDVASAGKPAGYQFSPDERPAAPRAPVARLIEAAQALGWPETRLSPGQLERLAQAAGVRVDHVRTTLRRRAFEVAQQAEQRAA